MALSTISTAPIPFDRKRKNELFLVIDRLKVNPTIHHRLFEAVENAGQFGKREAAGDAGRERYSL